MSKRLEGKVAVITGAASGIGAATAKTFVEQGARVVLGDIQDQAGAELAEALGGSGTAIFRHCNVTSEAEVEALVDAADRIWASVGSRRLSLSRRALGERDQQSGAGE